MTDIADHLSLPLMRLERPWWHALAACNDPSIDSSIFYPNRGPGGYQKLKAAELVCGGCEVRQACLDYALSTSEKIGFWGGLSERQRKRIRRDRARERRGQEPIVDPVPRRKRRRRVRVAGCGVRECGHEYCELIREVAA